MRLLFAAERGGPGLELEALRLAAEHAKQGEDTQFYAQARPFRDAKAAFRLITLFAALERAADARVVLCGAGDGQDRRPAGCRIHDGQGVGGADGQARVAGARRCSLRCQLPPSLRRRAHAASLAPAQKHERLEAELNAAKANSVKARRC